MKETGAVSTKPMFRRRKFLIQPAYQLRVAAVSLLCILTYSALLGLLIFYPLYQEYMAAAGPEEQAWIARQVLYLNDRFWPSVLLVGLLVAIQSVFVTHRVVGPAYHLRQALERLTAGNLAERAHLRRFDRLKEIEVSVNGLAEALERAAVERERERERLLAALAAVRPALADPGVPTPLRQGIQELDRILGASEDAR
jgi:methyl-accepting chemotaxis protein